jgi:5-methylcytosine-specific restriction endonuclease McrA
MTIQPDVRRAVLAVAKSRCIYCGGPADRVTHIVPLNLGGAAEPENLVAACADCLQGSAEQPTATEQDEARALAVKRAPRVMQLAAAMRGADWTVEALRVPQEGPRRPE